MSISPSVAESGTTRLPFSIEPLGAARALASSSVLPLRNQLITSSGLTCNVTGGKCIWNRGGKDVAP